jgi:basic membrane lipoprotein Med (substrate-binding protein (PBP1-ABC) superfamily)
MPYAGVRTYYSRIYEGKFITGAIAGAMSRENRIGYVANYPIFGVPAGINAFALGARMTNPDAKIVLHWSCLPGSAPERFAKRDISVVSNREAVAGSVANRAWDWGTYQFRPDGTMLPLASPCWDWGAFYEKVVLTIFAGGWDSQKARFEERAVNYWWGMDSGVIDVQLSDELPDGVRQLALILKDGLTRGTIDPFYRVIRSQDGTVRNDGTQHFTPEEIMNMDWLCDNVEGWIPSFDELLPMSRNMVRLLGIYRDQLPPEKEGVIL